MDRTATGEPPVEAQPAIDRGATGSGPGAPRRRRPLISRIARAVVIGAVLAVCAVVVWWWASGGKWYIVSTPSMGTYAPVGTLVWVKPTNITDIHVGQVVTVRSPIDGYPFTHRVVARDPDGTLQTKGDINASRDPWRIDQQHLVGRVAAAWKGVGWLVKALPLLLIGGVAWWALTGLLASGRSRTPLRILGAAGLVAAAMVIYEPFFGAVQVSFNPLTHGAKATYVGTGLLPAELQTKGASPVLIHSGQVGSIVATHADLHHRYYVTVARTVPWQVWAVVIAACLAPAVWSTVVGIEPSPPWRRRRWPWQHHGAEPTGSAA